VNLGPPKRSVHKSNGRISLEFPPTPAAMSFSQILQSLNAASRGDDLDVRDIANDFKHGGLSLAAVGQETIADASWVEAPLVLLSNLRSLSLSLGNVRPDL
jgi:hypothetical protein